jgi:hypothetical protein
MLVKYTFVKIWTQKGSARLGTAHFKINKYFNPNGIIY